MSNPPPPPSVAEFIEVWHEGLQAIVDVSQPLSPEQWQLPTACEGWSVADVVAHVIDLEQLFGGEARPEHEPHWDSLPHVRNDFGRLTEIGVDFRRGRTPEELLGELRVTIMKRRAQLDSLPEDAEVFGPPAGKMMPLERFLRTRTFDTWIHEQDIRWATGNDGGWNTAPAGVAFSQMANATPYVWARNVKAPVGSVLQLSVIGPDMHHQSWVTVDEDGRGVFAPDETPPTLDAAMTWAAFMRLSAGRVTLDDPWLRDKVELHGDAELGHRLLTAMNIAP